MKRIISIILWQLVAAIALANSPINWVVPETFDPNIAGLGLEQLEGISHEVIYDPKISAANTNLGGDGIYESLEHGMFNHDPRIILTNDKLIVQWNNHATDESAPGGRILAKVGTISADKENISWGGAETLVEAVPPPALVKSRLWDHGPEVIDEHFGLGGLSLINGRLYTYGSVQALHGWSNDPKYANKQDAPEPPTHGFSVQNSAHKSSFYRGLKRVFERQMRITSG